MAAPATLVIAKILIPETGQPLTRGTVKMEVEKTHSNIIDAAAGGAADGLRLALNIAAMLLAFVALIAMLNCAAHGWVGDWQPALPEPEHDAQGRAATRAGRAQLGLILGYLLAPIAWVIGVPWQDADHGRRPDRPEGRAQRIHRLPATGARSSRHRRRRDQRARAADR